MAKLSKIITKASAYLKRGGNNLGNSFEVSNSKDLVVDASNFYRLIQGGNKVVFQAGDQDLSGKGFMEIPPDLDLVDGFPLLEYPITALDEGSYTLWLRYKSPVAEFKPDILFDGNTFEILNEPISSSFIWVSLQVVFPDTNKHIIGIEMKDKGNALDKIYITKSSDVPVDKGPDLTKSPFITVHMQVFKVDSETMVPTEPLFIYDHKNTLDEVITDDWYNFDTRVLDDRIKEKFIVSDSEKFSLVLTTSGSNFENFIIWELVDSDEYLVNPSVIKG